MPFRFLPPFLVAALLAGPASAHEFWIDPLSYQIAPAELLIADNRVGEKLKGDAYPYAAHTFERFTITDTEGTRPVTGRLGDMPAMAVETRAEGLHIVAFQSVPSVARYKSAEKFTAFLDQEGLTGIADAHRARGLPPAGFGEAFTRFAKSLVAVGSGAGADEAVGFRLELIAEANPYTDSGPMSVQLLLEGAPLSDTQISIFKRSDSGALRRSITRTDAEGRARIRTRPGTMVLLNAVHMVEPTRALMIEKQAVWHSLWASLTFETPQ